MRAVPLGDLIVKAKSARAGSGDYPLLSMTMHEGLVDQATKFKKRVASDDTSSYKIIKRGQLVVGFPIDEAVLDFQLLYKEGIVSPAYGVWDIADEALADRDYLKKYLRSDRAIAYYKAKLRGSTARRRSLPEAEFLSHPIPLPPLPEQRRIAAILDHADTLRAKRRQVLTHLDSLTQAIYEGMIGSIDWPYVKIKTITSKVGSGATPRGGQSAYKMEGVALIRSMNVHDGKFRWKDLAFLDDQQAAALSNVVVEADDVLLNITGASVARVSRAPAGVLPARVNQHVAIIRPARDTVHPRILERHLISPRTKRALLNVAGGGATREAITKAQILDLAVPMPDRPAQERYLAVAARLDEQQERLRAALEAAESLFVSLQSRAFRGEL